MNMVRTAALLAAMTALFMAVGWAIGGREGMWIALAVATVTNLFSYWNADKMVLSMYRAVEVGPDTAPGYYEIVRQLAEKAQMPMPRVYVFEQAQPNAFATGRSPAHAAVAASTGLLDMLDEEEVAGVVAHELAHIANRDTLTMTITATLAGAISMLGNFAFFFGGSRDRDNPLGPLGVLLAVLVAPFAAMIVQMAVSRTREYAADDWAGRLVGQPMWLASALNKIAGATRAVRSPLAERNPASAHMFIMNPLGAHARDSLFSTHPDPVNRIEALRRLAEALEEAVDEALVSAPPERTLPRREGRGVPEIGGSRRTVPDRPATEGPWGGQPDGPRGRVNPWSGEPVADARSAPWRDGPADDPDLADRDLPDRPQDRPTRGPVWDGDIFGGGRARLPGEADMARSLVPPKQRPERREDDTRGRDE